MMTMMIAKTVGFVVNNVNILLNVRSSVRVLARKNVKMKLIANQIEN